jgi:hypothetical protein
MTFVDSSSASSGMEGNVFTAMAASRVAGGGGASNRSPFLARSLAGRRPPICTPTYLSDY